MICKKCLQEVPDNTNFCLYCGNPLHSGNTPKTTTSEQNPTVSATPKTDVYQISYHLDLVFCIDSTESMDNILDLVKDNAVNLYSDIIDIMKEKNKHINSMRIRVISFRDYLADGKEAMLTTPFFHLPQDAADFSDCVHSLEAKGGGDDPEDAYEALGFAMCSDWNKAGMKKRHVIVLWTDAPSHPLGYGRQRSNYPKDMAKDFRELTAWWGAPGVPNAVMDQYAKRLILFAPDDPSWNTIADQWDKVIQCHTIPGNGLAEQDYKTIINVISNTI